MTSTFLEKLAVAQAINNSFLCPGLDPNPDRFPEPWKGDSDKIGDFCEGVVDQTGDLALCFKPQIAYFARHRAEDALEEVIDYVHAKTEVPVILDVKRCDIGDTSEQYACEVFDRYHADAATVSPYMGYYSFAPFLRPGKGVFLLCRTSNEGGDDLQNRWLLVESAEEEEYFESLQITSCRRLDGGMMLVRFYCHVAYMAMRHLNTNGQLGLVVGATYPDELKAVRKIAPHLPLLIPGYGTQGATAKDVMAVAGSDAPVIAVAARSLLYPEQQRDEMWRNACRRVARRIHGELNAAYPIPN